MQVNVLGAKYNIVQKDKKTDNTLENLENVDGYCDYTIKKCVIDTFLPAPGSLVDLEAYKKQVIRHELVHAFLFESGLGSSSWASNEEIVDWIAFQFPKMLEAFKEANAL